MQGGQVEVSEKKKVRYIDTSPDVKGGKASGMSGGVGKCVRRAV